MAQQFLHSPTDFAWMDERTSVFLTVLRTAWTERWRQINIIPLPVKPSQGKSWRKWSHFFLCLTDKLLMIQAVTFRRESKLVFTHNLIIPQQDFCTISQRRWIVTSMQKVWSLRCYSANHLLFLYVKPRSKKAALASGWCNPKLTNALSIT